MGPGTSALAQSVDLLSAILDPAVPMSDLLVGKPREGCVCP